MDLCVGTLSRTDSKKSFHNEAFAKFLYGAIFLITGSGKLWELYQQMIVFYMYIYIHAHIFMSHSIISHINNSLETS